MVEVSARETGVHFIALQHTTSAKGRGRREGKRSLACRTRQPIAYADRYNTAESVDYTVGNGAAKDGGGATVEQEEARKGLYKSKRSIPGRTAFDCPID